MRYLIELLSFCEISGSHGAAYEDDKSSGILCEISSSHGGEYEAQNLLECTAVFLIKCRQTFLRGTCCLHHQGDLPDDGGSTYR
jgi:hypothetical protein